MVKRLLVVFLLLSLGALVLAQAPVPGARKLRPQDVLRIQVFGQQQIIADVPVDVPAVESDNVPLDVPAQ